MSSTLVGVYWAARSDELHTCVELTCAHFGSLVDADHGLRRWFRKAMRKPKTPTEVDVRSADEVSSLLAKGVNRRDTDNAVIPELGWSLSLWNGDLHGTSASTSVHCGCTFSRVGNRALVEVSRDTGKGLDDITAITLLRALIDVWDADTGVVSHSAWDDQRQQNEDTQVASYRRGRWPVFLPKNAVRCGKGVIRLAS